MTEWGQGRLFNPIFTPYSNPELRTRELYADAINLGSVAAGNQVQVVGSAQEIPGADSEISNSSVSTSAGSLEE